MSFELFKFQKNAVQSIFNHYDSGKTGNPLVVAPTGSGKSVMIADFVRIVIKLFPDQNILVVSHDAEVLVQDLKAITTQLESGEKVGLYSSGLKSKEIKQITVAGIQSIYNKHEEFGHFDIILVDEAHMIAYGKKSRYQVFLKNMNKPVVGFTATPFRLGSGYLHLAEDAVFSDITYTITIKELQKAGRLCEIISKQPGVILDASGIKKQSGDFIIKELSMAFDRSAITQEIVEDLIKYKESRKKWMVYAIDIEHCENIAAELNKAGVKTIVLHSKTEGGRKVALKKFRSKEYQAIVSVAMLTTGVDVPEVDLIALLRPTASPVLHVQIIGRGMRISPLKANCLVLDYAGNLMRNGPIDSPNIVLKGKGNGDAMMKVCENCDEIVPIATRTCKQCGNEFVFKHNLTMSSSNGDILSKEIWHDVSEVTYSTYTGSKGIEMFCVVYRCGFNYFKEFVCFDHKGFAKHKAKHWWIFRATLEGPPAHTSKQALELSDTLREPTEILVDTKGRYDDIKDYKF